MHIRPGMGAASKAFEERTGIKAPRIVAWEITRSCNLACAHCRAAAHCEPYPGELSLDECKAVMDDIASICDPILILTGGEPLMRPDIWDIIDYAHEVGLHPVIGTNGTLIDDECAANISKHGIARVSVSLDFPDAAGQDAFRGKEGAFEEAITGMRNLRKHGVGVQVNTTVTKLNSHLVKDMHDLALAEGADAFHPFLLVPTGRGEDLVDVELSPDEYEEVLTWACRCMNTSPMQVKPTDAPQFRRIQQQLREAGEIDGAGGAGNASGPDGTHGPDNAGGPGGAHGAGNASSDRGAGEREAPAGHPKRGAAGRGCLGGITFVFISHVGDVQPCGYFDMQLGNVRERPFSEIWETSPVFDDLRHFDRLRGKCGACEYKGICGGCRARALAATGDYLAEEPYCAYIPRTVARQMVLDEIQSGFPLEHDPYGVLASRLGLDRKRVLEAVSSLMEDGTIRHIGASFSSRHLGYTSTLCALSATGDEAEIDRIAALVSAHPEVTHNYLRDGAYNVWFTIIAPSTAEIERIVAEISTEAQREVMNLPVTKIYKIRVDFSGKTEKKNADGSSLSAAPFDPNDPFDVELVRYTQGGITGELPFASGNFDEERALERLREWKANGTIRRFGAFVQHRKMGYAFNGMTVWDVPDDQCDRIGGMFAELPSVSHCYQRMRNAKWPYNLYAMVHAKTQAELDERVAKMRALAECDCQVLVSRKEFKKASPVYYRQQGS